MVARVVSGEMARRRIDQRAEIDLPRPSANVADRLVARARHARVGAAEE
jgi:hypothetical protein